MRAAVVVLLAVAAVACWPAAAAQAACPAKPAAYTGADPVVMELRELRREQVDVCNDQDTRLNTIQVNTSTTAARLVQSGVTVAASSELMRSAWTEVFGISYTSGWPGLFLNSSAYTGKRLALTAEQTRDHVAPLHDDVDQVEPKLDALHTDLTVGPVPVSGAAGGAGGPVELSATDRALVESGFNELIASSWFAIGLLAVGVGAGALLRQFLAR